jgi:predicted metal-dependent hydrolase
MGLGMTPSHVTIIRSPRRKKTIQTKYTDGQLWIYLPANMARTEEEKWVHRMIEKSKRWEQKASLKNSDTWLMKRAQEINKKYFHGTLHLNSICFVTNQHSRFGSCTSTDHTIRISDRVKTMPSWVQEYVILHEMAHLIVPDHSKKFWDLVNHYKFAERAKGYLIALGATDEETSE